MRTSTNETTPFETEFDPNSDPLSDATLGGSDSSAPYHALAQDPTTEGLWGKIDRLGERLTTWLNPILIKEARQSLKSKQFLVIFFSLLVASWGWTILGIMVMSPDVFYTPSGSSLLGGYYFILAIPLMGLVPIVAFFSLASELDNGTFEMLAITQLSASRIVIGKLNSAMLQMLIYFAAIVPCLAFSYLLRGISLPSILYLLCMVFGVALLITTFALLLATLTTIVPVQIFTLIGLVAVIIFAQFMCGIFVFEAILEDRMPLNTETVLNTSYFYAVGLSFVVMFVMAASARIAPVTENRSTKLRWMMLVQTAIWIVVMTSASMYYEDIDPINAGLTMLGIYWLLAGALMLGESHVLSPRVQRGLPKTYLTRMFLTWLNPGPGTGFMFAICSGAGAFIVLAWFGEFLRMTNNWSGRNTTSPMVFSMIMIGYLFGYLGLIRLIVMPLTRKFGNSLVLPIVVTIMVMFICAITPMLLHVLFTGSPPMRYQPTEALDWAWTWAEAIDRRFDPATAAMILAVGSLVFFINLMFLFREFRYRRIAVPRRVLAEEGAA